MSPRLEKAPWKQGAFGVSGGLLTSPASAPGLCRGYEKRRDTSRSSGRFPLSDRARGPTIREHPTPAGPSSLKTALKDGARRHLPSGGGARVATYRAKAANSSFKRHHGLGWPHACRPPGSRQSHDSGRPGGLCACARQKARRRREPPEQPLKTVTHQDSRATVAYSDSSRTSMRLSFSRMISVRMLLRALQMTIRKPKVTST